jgi:hypothetical protein
MSALLIPGVGLVELGPQARLVAGAVVQSNIDELVAANVAAGMPILGNPALQDQAPATRRAVGGQPFMPPPREITIAAASARSQGRAFARASIGLVLAGSAVSRGAAGPRASSALLVGMTARATGISHPAIVPGSIAQSIARSRGRAGPRASGIDHVLIVRKRLAAQRLLGLM